MLDAQALLASLVLVALVWVGECVILLAALHMGGEGEVTSSVVADGDLTDTCGREEVGAVIGIEGIALVRVVAGRSVVVVVVAALAVVVVMAREVLVAELALNVVDATTVVATACTD